jgi:hypothetical protein
MPWSIPVKEEATMKPPIRIPCLFACVAFLYGCPPARKKLTYLPPGPTSLAYECSLNKIGTGLPIDSGTKTFFFTWLESTKPDGDGKILVSDEKYDHQSAAVIFIVDNEKRIVDQIRDRMGNPVTFDLNTRFITLSEANSQLYMRVGNLILDSSARALEAAPKNADAVAFRFDQNLYQFSKSNSIPSVENYSQLPRTISSDGATVCSFTGFTKTSSPSNGEN